MDVTVPQRLAAAVLIALGGYVHFKIWQHEYRHAPVREMFIANWVASAALAVVLVVVALTPRVPRMFGSLTLVAGLALSLGSLLALGISRGPGLPTLHGTFKETGLETTASYFFGVGSAKTIIVTESLAALLCAALLVQVPPRPVGRRRS